MSRPKHYWYGIARKMIEQYPKLNESKVMEKCFKDAIKQQLDLTSKSEDGESKIKAVETVCFAKKSIEDAAKEMHYSERTIQRWIAAFINDVGRKAGF